MVASRTVISAPSGGGAEPAEEPDVADVAVVAGGAVGSDERPASPRERRVAKTRRAIIDAARELFDEHGYDGTTIDQIADRVDIAPRTFFRYFPSKEALVFADLDEQRQLLWPLLDARPAGEAPLRALVAALADYADTVEVNHARLEWGFRIAESHPGVSYQMTVIKDDTRGRITEFLAGRLGVDPAVDPRPKAWAVSVMAIFATAVEFAVGHDDRDRRSVREVFLELVADTVTALKRVPSH